MDLMVRITRNGISSILTKLVNLRQRDSTKSLASILTDHSISDLECQWRELLPSMETTGSIWEDGLQLMPNMPNGDSMRNQSSSSTCGTPTTLWKSTVTEDIHTLEPQQQRTPDGGNCSELKELTLEPSRRLSTNTSTFKEPLTQKEDISNVMRPRTEESINNGMSSTLTHGRENQPRDNSMKSMDST